MSNDPFFHRRFWLLGASHGIGRALATQLHRRGASLVLSGRSRDALTILNSDLGGVHEVVTCDVSNPDSVAAAAETVTDSGKAPLDSLIYLAGFYEPGYIADASLENIDKSLAINFTGAVLAVQGVLPEFRRLKRGQIVICGSLSACRGLPKGQPYSASKAALVNFTESLRAEWQPQGVDVRLLSPGFVKTRLTARNDFDMPELQTPDQAASAIIRGLEGSRFDIAFPRRFALKLQLLRLLPDWFYFRIATSLRSRKR